MKKADFNLKGIFPPLTTSFKNNGELDFNNIRKNLLYYNKFNLGGYVVLGSNGEFVLLDEDEKVILIKTVKDMIPSDKYLIAGLGCQSTKATIRLCKKAADNGTDAALIITPSYYKGKMTETALFKFFTETADNSPIPIILYNMPACTGIDISTNLVTSLANHPNIIGLKDSSGNIIKMGEIINNKPEDFQVLAGSAGFLLASLSIGSIGGILALANIAPAECIKIQELFFEGKIEEAKTLQNSLISLNQKITRIGGIPALKSAMDYLGLYGGPVRSPLMVAEPKEIQEIELLLKKANIKKINI